MIVAQLWATLYKDCIPPQMTCIDTRLVISPEGNMACSKGIELPHRTCYDRHILLWPDTIGNDYKKGVISKKCVNLRTAQTKLDEIDKMWPIKI